MQKSFKNAFPGVNALDEGHTYPMELFPSNPKIVFTPSYHRLIELS